MQARNANDCSVLMLASEILAVLIILEMSRIRAEERKLHDAFGKRYEVYKKNTWF
jgi:protein-S-isoprenylcysteine O-methyltransferase Ste14